MTFQKFKTIHFAKISNQDLIDGKEMLKLSSLFKCHLCQNIFDSAITLPCGQTICKKHVQELQTEVEDKNVIVCELCHDNHQIPMHGFQENVIVNELLRSELPKVNFGIVYAQALEKCHRMKSLIEEFEHIDKDKQSIIFEYFSKLRNTIDTKKRRG